MKEIYKLILYPIKFIDKKVLVLLMIFSMLASILSFPLPILQKYLFNELIAEDYRNVFRIIIYLLIVFFFQIIIKSYANYLSFIYEENSYQCMKKHMLLEFLSMDFIEADSFEKEYIHNRIDKDSRTVTRYSSSIIKDLVPNTLLFILSVVYIIYYSKLLLLLSIIILLVILLLYKLMSKILYQTNSTFKEEENNLYADFSETINNLQLIKINLLEHFENKKFTKRIYEYLKIYKKLVKYTSIFLSCTSSFQIIITILILCIGAYNVMKGSLTVGDIVTLIAMSSYIIIPIYTIIEVISNYPEARASESRIHEIVNKTKLNNGVKTIDSINALNVNIIQFAYKEHKVIENFKYEFKKGKIYEIIGENGSGKSTLLKIISKLYSTYEGDIMVNGHIDIHDICFESHMSHISYIEQMPHLFRGSIADNLFYGDNNYKEEKINHLKKGNLSKFAESLFVLPEGLNTCIIDKSGNSISGGEKQKISIIRELLKDSDVILLDEATNSLDKNSVKLLYTYLSEIKEEKIIIIVTHQRENDSYVDEIINI